MGGMTPCIASKKQLASPEGRAAYAQNNKAQLDQAKAAAAGARGIRDAKSLALETARSKLDAADAQWAKATKPPSMGANIRSALGFDRFDDAAARADKAAATQAVQVAERGAKSAYSELMGASEALRAADLQVSNLSICGRVAFAPEQDEHGDLVPGRGEFMSPVTGTPAGAYDVQSWGYVWR